MDKLTLNYVDEDGATASHHIPIRTTMLIDGASAQALLDAIDVVSNAGVNGLGRYREVTDSDVVGTGPYVARDKLVTAFATVTGVAIRVAVPAPVRALLAVNDEAWAAGEALVDSFASAFAAACVTAGSNAIGALKKSYRSRT